MAENSNIEWCDHTFNPWRGCDAMWREPLKWESAADRCRLFARGVWIEKSRTEKHVQFTELRNPRTPCMLTIEDWDALPRYRPRVFCASLADWLDAEVPVHWLSRLLVLVHETPNLDWLLLTKRPENFMHRILGAASWLRGGLPAANREWIVDWDDGKPPPNVWIGTTVEDQQRSNERIPLLLNIPAKVRFLSCEPLLSAVDLRQVGAGSLQINALNGGWAVPRNHGGKMAGQRGVDWVIAGGESGPSARPMHPQWARALRDHCAAAQVPFLFKQWGEFRPAVQTNLEGEIEAPSLSDDTSTDPFGDGTFMLKVGKKKGGRLLDGREWNEFPTLRGGSAA